MTALLPRGDHAALSAAARRLRAAVPGGDAYVDPAAVVDGMLATLDQAAELPPEVWLAQLESDLLALSSLVAATAAPASAVPALPAWVDAAMLAEFHDSQRHALAELEELLLRAAAPEGSDRQWIARTLHTMKGESSTLGFEALEHLYHALEDRVAAGPPEIADPVLAVKDWVLAALPALVAQRPVPSGYDGLIAMLKARATPATAVEAVPRSTGPEPKTTLPTDPEVLALFGEFFEEAMDSLIQADEMLVVMESSRPDGPTVDALFRVFHTLKGLAGFLDLGTLGALAHAAEALLHDARDDLATMSSARVDLLLRSTSMSRKLLVATQAALAEGRSEVRVDGFDQLLQQVIVARSERAPTPATAARQSRPEPRSPEPGEAPAAGEGGEEDRGNVKGARETIKVDLLRVDSLVETIGELVIIEAMVASSATQLPVRTQRYLAHLSKVTRDLQRQGLGLRMVPLRSVFQKMNRLVRDLSRRSQKLIRLELSGQDAEMDRSLSERLGDPLVHLIRNGVDHGVEPPEERRAAGKPETATLRLSAYHEGGNIIIEIADDGRGLNRDAILRKAIERGLIAPTAQPSDREIWELIFHPGFSTAARVTELSGRGVGMDVVKKTVDELRGRIQIATVPGQGTTFRLVLPLTLAIIDGMLVVVGGHRYVLPTLAIVESMQPEVRQIHALPNGPKILHARGERLPLVDLGALLGVAAVTSHDPSQGFVVVVDGLRGRFGVLVDELIGQQQVVIKQVDAAVNRGGLFSGAAILSDGQVGLILNPATLRAEDDPTRLAEAG